MSPFKLFLTAAAVVVAAYANAQIDDAIIGTYSAAQSPKSNQEYKLLVELSRRADKLAVDINVVWQPGVSCEINSVLDASNVGKSVDANGATKYTIAADFEDSHSNKGTMSLVITSSTCVMRLIPTETVEPAATRQYGTYTLTRVSSP